MVLGNSQYIVMRKTKPSLSQLVDQLRKSVSNEADNDSILLLATEISRRLAKKQDRLRGRYQLPFADWAAIVKDAPRAIEDFLILPDFLIMLKRDVDITFHHGQQTKDIWNKADGTLVSVKTYKDRLLIMNPYASGARKLQSWARPKSVSRERPDHLAKYRNSRKSKFLESVAVDRLEIEIFNLAVAQIIGERTIHHYGRCNQVVGHLASGEPTLYVRVESTREPRLKGAGFYTQLHSYPISMSDIELSALIGLRKDLEEQDQFIVPYIA